MASQMRIELSEATSVLLDAIRFSAALAVLVGHFTQPAFSTGWPNLTAFSIAAVGAFFVMSGLVIEYTHPRHIDLSDYARARLVRLWSVLIPALLYTAFADTASWYANSAYYAQWQHSLASNAISFWADVFFLNESWARELSFGSDNPVWSLGYEAGYYALFGAFVYLRGGWRIAVLALLVAVKGPQLLVLLPAWLLGVLTCRLLLRKNGSALRIAAGSVAIALCLALIVFGRGNNTSAIQQLMDEMPGGGGHSAFLFTMMACGFATSALILLAEETIRFWGPALLSCQHAIRWLAQATFSIYLFHLPTLIFLQATTGYSRSSALSKIVVLAATFGICVALSLVTERRKSWLDPAVRKILRLPRVDLSWPAGRQLGASGAMPPGS